MQCRRNKQIIKVLKRNFYYVEPQPATEKAEEIEKPCLSKKKKKKLGILFRNKQQNNVEGYWNITGYVREAK